MTFQIQLQKAKHAYAKGPIHNSKLPPSELEKVETIQLCGTKSYKELVGFFSFLLDLFLVHNKSEIITYKPVKGGGKKTNTKMVVLIHNIFKFAVEPKRSMLHFCTGLQETKFTF